MQVCKVCKTNWVGNGAPCVICQDEVDAFWRKFSAPAAHPVRVWAWDNIGLIVFGLGFALFGVAGILA